MNIAQTIAKELSVTSEQVSATITLLDGGATVPFIARYRKEATQGLDDTQLRTLEERLIYLRELVDRRDAILASIREQEKLTPELEKALLAADTKARLEDLYLPFKPRRRTKAQIAREAGLEPLAMTLLNDPTLNPEQEAAKFLNAEHKIETAEAALDGARSILMEQFSENADLVNSLREYVWQHGIMQSVVAKNKEKEGIKFKYYSEYREALVSIPSHRALALFHGQKETYLRLNIIFPEDANEAHCLQSIAQAFSIKRQATGTNWLRQVVE